MPNSEFNVANLARTHDSPFGISVLFAFFCYFVRVKVGINLRCIFM